MWYVTKSAIDITDVDIFEITEVAPANYVASFEAGSENPLFAAATAIAQASLITSGNGLRVIYAESGS